MFTLSNCITRINQILNYPAISYDDVSHFFDQAISELNTTFKIGIPLVSEMVAENQLNIQDLPNVVLIKESSLGGASDIIVTSDNNFTQTDRVYYNPIENKFYKYNVLNATWCAYGIMYGVFVDNSFKRVIYQAIPMPLTGTAYWSPVDETRTNDFDLINYLPVDFIILFIIPYVCFKFSVRDGNSGELYNEEWTQGFQQLQTSYDVPHFVNLSKVAHLPAYTNFVKKHIDMLGDKISTRAIYDSMKIGNNIAAQYGGFYENGGWGV